MRIQRFGGISQGVLIAGVAFASACSPDRPSEVPSPTPAASPELPEYRLTGHVGDTAIRPVAGARVEVVSGPKAGTFATTDASGFFTMPGTFAGNIEIVATKGGYISQTKSIPPSWPPSLPPPPPSESYRVQFWLEPVGTVDAVGVYAMTLSADRACAGLPADARTRTYTATLAGVTPTSRTSLLIRASDARFFTTHNRGSASVAGDFVRIVIAISDRSQSFSVAGIVEELGDGIYVAIHGWAEGTWRRDGMAGTFQGSFEYCPGEPGLIDRDLYSCTAPARILCESEHHQLAIVRR